MYQRVIAFFTYFAHLSAISINLFFSLMEFATRLTFVSHKREYLLFAVNNCSFN